MSTQLTLRLDIYLPSRVDTFHGVGQASLVYLTRRIEWLRSLFLRWRWVLIRQELDWDQVGADLIPLPKIRVGSLLGRLVVTVAIIVTFADYFNHLAYGYLGLFIICPFEECFHFICLAITSGSISLPSTTLFMTL